MNEVEIVWRKQGGPFNTSTEHTGMPQRQKQEQIIKNLCKALSISKVYKEKSQREAIFYCPDTFVCYQSATNTILELSELVLERIK